MNSYFSTNFFALDKNQRDLVFLVIETAFIDQSVQKFLHRFYATIRKQEKRLVILNYFAWPSGFSTESVKERIHVIEQLFPDIYWVELKKPLHESSLTLWRKSWRFSQWLTFLPRLATKKVELLDAGAENLVNLAPVITTALQFGNLPEVTKLLGYYYCLRGKIVHGQKHATSIGFPTTNLRLPQHSPLPLPGCFVTLVRIDGDQKIYFGLTCLINEPKRKVFETYIRQFSQDIYRKKISVYFLFRYRDNYPFTNLLDLKSWIEKDLELFNQKITFDESKVL